MQDKRSKLEGVLVRLAPILIAVAAVLLVISILRIDKTQYAVQETAAYTRVSSCIVSKVANRPTTQDDVEKCYIQVEKSSNIPLERFDEQINNENIKR